jgi:hypothetical protein
MKINPAIKAAFKFPVKYLTNEYVPNPETINELSHRIVYVLVSPKIYCNGIETIPLNGVIVEKAKFTPVG